MSGWQPDPLGRHELRYHDGADWTEHVSDGGVQGVDPVHSATPARLQPRESSPGGRRGLIIAVAALTVCVALVAGGLVVKNTVLGRGAGSPEEAVRSFVAAVADFDPRGAARMVNPEEIDGLVDLYEGARDRLEREKIDTGVLSEADRDKSDRALQISVAGLELKTRELSDDLAWVSLVDGSYEVSWDPGRLSGDAARIAKHVSGNSWRGTFHDLLDLDDEYNRDVLGLHTVKVGGRWFVSLLPAGLTGLNPVTWERWYGEEGEPPLDFASDLGQPVLGDSPEEAVRNLATNSLVDFFRALPRGQARALLPYVRAHDRWIREDVDVEVRLDELSVDVEDLGGGRHKVVVKEAELYLWADEDRDGDSGFIDVGIRGLCWSVESYDYGYSQDEGCLRDEAPYLGFDEFFIVVREQAGGYQVDPVATATEYGRVVIDGISSQALRDLHREILYEICYDVSGCDEEF